jgi:hypothetical protein
MSEESELLQKMLEKMEELRYELREIKVRMDKISK